MTETKENMRANIKGEAKSIGKNFKYVKANKIPIPISTKGYWNDILLLQFLHFPPRVQKLTTGISSNHERVFLQLMQDERPPRFFCVP